MRTLFLVWTVLLGLFAAQAEARLLSADLVREPQSLLPYCSWLSDPKGSHTVESVSSGSLQEHFAPLDREAMLKSEGPVWLRLVMLKSSLDLGGDPGQSNGSRLVLNLGQIPSGKARIFFSEPPGPVAAEGLWHAEDVSAHENVILPEPGLTQVGIYIRLAEMPGLWFSPVIRPEASSKAALLPWEMILPGLLIAAAAACLLRGFVDRSVWALWAGLFALCCLIQAALPQPAAGGGLSFERLPSLLAPGLALLLLPHVGRCFFRTDKGHPVQDIWLYTVSLLGLGLALAPFVPGLNWLVRLFPLWPLLLVLMLPVCFKNLAAGKAGALAYLGVCLLPALGAGLTLYVLFEPSLLHPLTAQAGLWGLAVGCLGLALAKGLRADAAQEALEESPKPLENGQAGGSNFLQVALQSGRGSNGLPLSGRSDVQDGGFSYFNLQAFGPDREMSEEELAAEAAAAAEAATGIDAQNKEDAPEGRPGQGFEQAGHGPAEAWRGLAQGGQGLAQDAARPLDEAEKARGPQAMPDAVPDPESPRRQWTVIRNLSEEDEANAPGRSAEPESSGTPAIQGTTDTSEISGISGTAVAAAARAVQEKHLSGPRQFKLDAFSGAAAEERAEALLSKEAELSASGKETERPVFDKKAEQPASAKGTEQPDFGMEAGQPASATPHAEAKTGSPADSAPAWRPSPGPVPDFVATPLAESREAAEESKIISLIDEDLSGYVPEMPDRFESGSLMEPDTLGDDGIFLFSLHSLVRDVHDVVEPLAKAKGLIFSWYINPSLPSLLEGDAPRLRGALSLLLQNAVQVTRKGAVQLAVRRNPVSDQPGDLLFSISDNGSTQRTDAGFFHAWELAARSGGSFNVEYAPHSGTQISFTVRFDLPTAQAARDHMARHPFAAALYPELVRDMEIGQYEDEPMPVLHNQDPASLPDLPETEDQPLYAAMRPEQVLAEHGKYALGSPLPTVLAGEMTSSNRRLLTSCLADVPHEHINAENNEQVLEYYQSNPVGLIIFDADTPEPDVIRSITSLRQEDARMGRATPVLVLTTHTAQSVRMLEAGASYALRKPYKRQALRDMAAVAVPAFAPFVLKGDGRAPSEALLKRAETAGAARDALRRPAMEQKIAAPPERTPVESPTLAEPAPVAPTLAAVGTPAPAPEEPSPVAAPSATPVAAPPAASTPAASTEQPSLEAPASNAPPEQVEVEAPLEKALDEAAMETAPAAAPEEKEEKTESAASEAARESDTEAPQAAEDESETAAAAAESKVDTDESKTAVAESKAAATTEAAGEAPDDTSEASEIVEDSASAEKTGTPVSVEAPQAAAAAQDAGSEPETDLLVAALRDAPGPWGESSMLPAPRSDRGDTSSLEPDSGFAAQGDHRLLEREVDLLAEALRDAPLPGGESREVQLPPRHGLDAPAFPASPAPGDGRGGPAAAGAASRAAPMLLGLSPEDVTPPSVTASRERLGGGSLLDFALAEPDEEQDGKQEQDKTGIKAEEGKTVDGPGKDLPQGEATPKSRPAPVRQKPMPVTVTVGSPRQRVAKSVQARVSRTSQPQPGAAAPAQTPPAAPTPPPTVVITQTQAAAPAQTPVAAPAQTPPVIMTQPRAAVTEKDRTALPAPEAATVTAAAPVFSPVSAAEAATVPDKRQMFAQAAAPDQSPTPGQATAPEPAPVKAQASAAADKTGPAPTPAEAETSGPAEVPAEAVAVAPEEAPVATGAQSPAPAPTAAPTVAEPPAPAPAPAVAEALVPAPAPVAAEAQVPDPVPAPAPAPAFALPGMEGEFLDPAVVPLVPGIIHALRQALADTQAAVEQNKSILVQEASARLASKAEHFDLQRLGKIARCVERAAEAGDLEAVSTLMQDLGPVTERYVAALDECFSAFLNVER